MAHQIVVPKVWRSELGSLGLFLLSSLLCSVISQNWPDATVVVGELYRSHSHRLLLHLPILWFIPFGCLVVPIFRIYNVRYVVDGQGLEATVGILALNQKVARIRYEDIRSVTTHQGVLDRLLDIGTLEAATAATSGLEITFLGVAAPLELHSMVESEREHRSRVARSHRHQSAAIDEEPLPEDSE